MKSYNQIKVKDVQEALRVYRLLETKTADEIEKTTKHLHTCWKTNNPISKLWVSLTKHRVYIALSKDKNGSRYLSWY